MCSVTMAHFEGEIPCRHVNSKKRNEYIQGHNIRLVGCGTKIGEVENKTEQMVSPNLKEICYHLKYSNGQTGEIKYLETI